MKISLLTDSSDSWFVPYGRKLVSKLNEEGHDAAYVFTKEDLLIRDATVCFLLSCTKIVGKQYLDIHEHNIVVHASDLPKGKGFSPLQWQVEEGKNEITLTLFEADVEVDNGPYYFKQRLNLEGHELLPEMRLKMAELIVEMCVTYANGIDRFDPIDQVGESSFYPRRTTLNDEVDPSKSIIELFNHFRIADNEKYPLFFELNGHKYTIEINRIA